MVNHFTALFQVHPGEPVLSQRRNLLEQKLDFYELDVHHATQLIESKHYRKTQWFVRLLFYRHGISNFHLSVNNKNIGLNDGLDHMQPNLVK